MGSDHFRNQENGDDADKERQNEFTTLHRKTSWLHPTTHALTPP
jgi:hypothetical protein